MRRRTLQQTLLKVLFAGLIAGAPLARAERLPDLSVSLEAVARMVSPTVVEIFTTSYVPGTGMVSRAADLVTTQRASGSGVIAAADGYIITNAHVVAGAQRLRVELPITGRTVNAQIVGIDLETDLAVIKVEEQNLQALPFGDSDELGAGQVVLAFGNPLGFHNSVSLGVVSAVARQLQPESPMVYVQTDASIHPGSSGGPLVDLRGRLVGINTLTVSQTGGNEGLGFAAPSNVVKTVYEQIRATGRVRRADIGVRVQTVTPILASGLGLAREEGVILADVMPGSPAAVAGLRPGDMVISLDGKILQNAQQFQTRLQGRVAGKIAAVEVMREGRSHKVLIPTIDRPDPFGNLPSPVDPRENLVSRLGILAVNLDPQIAEALPVVRVRSGVVVASTVDGAIEAKDGGLAAGDVIYSVNRIRVPGIVELRTALENLKSGDPVVLQLERRGALMYLAFMVE